MRRISFFLTKPQILAKQKWVTRRIGWGFAVPGMLAQPIEKGQGLKAGEKVVDLGGPIRVQDNFPEPLSKLLEDPLYGHYEAFLEGFPDWSGEQFVAFICKSSPGVTVDRPLNRIQFGYV